ncbi:MAG: ankyrin repeat domain-containing protein [Pirellulaceae bacterium]
MKHAIPIRTSTFALTHEHRGGLAADPGKLWPARDLITRAGGANVIEDLIDDLYRRIEQDTELGRVFPHFQTHSIKAFFVTALGGGPPQAGTTSLGPFHRGTIVTASLAGRWLRHMKAALKASPVKDDVAHEILEWLRPLAKKLVNTENHKVTEEPLIGTCSGVQTRQFIERSELLRAASRGRLLSIREAVESDPEILSFRNAEGRSLLWEAVSRGRVPIVDYLLEQGVNVNLPGCEPSVINLACSGKAKLGTAVPVTPWALAISSGHSRIADLLESAGALHDVFSAAWLGDVGILSESIEVQPSLRDAEDPAEDFQRITPLHHAIAGGRYQAAEWLVHCGAHVQPHSRWLLTHAALQNRVDLVELLLDNGADVHRSGVLGPLDCDDRPVADLLIARGFDINADSEFGAMLVRACRGDVSHHETTRVKTLLDYGADVNKDHYGLSALHYATRAGRLPLIQLLLDRGADVHRRDNDGLTPLAHLTKTRAKAEPIPVMELLTQHGADVNSQNYRGETILFFFARRENREVVRWLLDHGASADLKNNSGKTVLDVIRRRKSESIAAIQALLS